MPFLWGTATSAHQVEGNNRFNDWWEWEQTQAGEKRSGEACRHYLLYEQDFDLLQNLSHNAHRFSIEWSRLEPRENQWDENEFRHYENVLTALRARNIEPVSFIRPIDVYGNMIKNSIKNSSR